MENMRIEIGALGNQMKRVALDSGATSPAGIFRKPVAASAGNPVVGPFGHRVQPSHQESGHGVMFTHGPPLRQGYALAIPLNPSYFVLLPTLLCRDGADPPGFQSQPAQICQSFFLFWQ